MPTCAYNYSTYDTDSYIAALNQEIHDIYEKDPELLITEEGRNKLIARLLRRASMGAYQALVRAEGVAPTGAMLVDFNTKDKTPKVVGFGANHGISKNDPSAHAEIVAVRDTAKRLGRTDLSDLTLITSCECCPMCLAAATACNIDKIYFARTRDETFNDGFPDALKYLLMQEEGTISKQATQVEETQVTQLLNGHDAVVVVQHGKEPLHYYGDYNKAGALDPVDTPVIQAVKKACDALAAINGRPITMLPANTILVSRDKPHPLSLMAADWARIGRVRGEDPLDRMQDLPEKDTSRILYVRDVFESIPIFNSQETTAVDAEKVWDRIRHSKAIHVPENHGRAHLAAFEKRNELFTGSTGLISK